MRAGWSQAAARGEGGGDVTGFFKVKTKNHRKLNRVTCPWGKVSKVVVAAGSSQVSVCEMTNVKQQNDWRD